MGPVTPKTSRANPARRVPKEQQRLFGSEVYRRKKPPPVRLLRKLEHQCYPILVGIALGHKEHKLAPSVKEAKKTVAQLRSLGASESTIERVISDAEEKMAPGLQKMTSVDVRKQLKLTENSLGGVKIPLSKGKYAIVDAADYVKLSKFPWYYGFRGYAMRSKVMRDGSRKTVSMHREILGALESQEVDHINGDRLDNRRSNLRVISRSANLHNRGAYGPSKEKGVSFDVRKNCWRAEIGKNGKRIWLGYHKTKESARDAYRKASKKLYTGKDEAAR